MHTSTSTPLTVGQRLQIRRRQRGLPRRVVANLVGRSEEWLRLIESGQRPLNNIEALTRLAEVLRVDDPTELIDWPAADPMPSQPGMDDLHPLRQVLLQHPALGHPNDRTVDHLDPATLRSDIDECQQIWTSSRQRYSRLASELPAVIDCARWARWLRHDTETAKLLCDIYLLTRSMLAARGEHTLAGTVADRALSTAAHTRLPLLVAASAWHLAAQLLHTKNPVASHDCALAAVRRIIDLTATTVEAAALSGALYLMAAHAAAVAADFGESVQLVETARRVADELGAEHCVQGIAFGPFEVSVTEIETALVQLNSARAVQLAPKVDPVAEHTLDRRATYLLCQARAYVMHSDTTAATLALMKAATASPEEVHYNVEAHRCLRYVAQRDNHLLRAELDQLVELAGNPTSLPPS
ncbi:helix-turn-helix domain-containing protein [Nocardia sp. NPDC052316]|uniref:helix-turn-helix domain-containing protein n=1 Tax=Nocardia sp. NPDC052316 TaxID=3364329 RepID=UPI0037CAA9B8